MSCWLSRITIFENTFKARKSLAYTGLLTREFAFLVLLLATVSFAGCGERQVEPLQDHIVLRGTTMGTTYCVRYRPSDRCADQQSIHQVIEEELENINMQMSIRILDSRIPSIRKRVAR